MTTSLDLIYAIASENAQDAAAHFNAIIAERIRTAIEDRRAELAQSMFAAKPEEAVVEEEFVDESTASNMVRHAYNVANKRELGEPYGGDRAAVKKKYGKEAERHAADAGKDHGMHKHVPTTNKNDSERVGFKTGIAKAVSAVKKA